ncbi:MAG: hypothetical protein AAB368_10030, partial [bacterium]
MAELEARIRNKSSSAPVADGEPDPTTYDYGEADPKYIRDLATYTDTNRAASTTYYYRITARNAIPEESPLSVEVSTIPRDNVPPAPPTGLVVADMPSDQGTALNLNWSVSAEPDLASYSIQKATYSPFTVGFVARIVAPGTTHQEGVLSAGVTYYYHMRARDTAANDSAISSPDVSAYPQDNFAPLAPTGLGTGNAGTGNRLNVSWFANTETDLKDYRVRRSTGTGITAATAVLVTVSPTSYVDMAVVNGTTYYYKVAARDVNFNESGLSIETTGANPSDLGAPGAPLGLNVADAPGDQGFSVQLNWSANPETDLKDYRVYRSTSGNVTAGSSWTVVAATVAAPGTTHQDAGLTNGTTYFYKLSARDTALNESPLSVQVSIQPADNLAPASAAGLGAADVPADQGTALNLNWTANAEPDLKDYGVYRATFTPFSGNFQGRIAQPGTTAQDVGLSVGTTYYYQVTGRDVSLNESVFGRGVSAYPVDSIAPAPPNGPPIPT